MYVHKQTATSLSVVLIAHGPGPVCVCLCVYTSMASKSLAPSVQCKLDARRVCLLVGIRHTSLFITLRGVCGLALISVRGFFSLMARHQEKIYRNYNLHLLLNYPQTACARYFFK